MTTEHDNEHNPLGFVEASRHPARAVRWLWDTDKNGTPCLGVALRITAGDFQGEELRGRLYFDTDRSDDKGRTSADRSMEALDAMGCSGDLSTITDEGGGGLGEGDVELVVGINAKGYPEAKFINPPGRGGAAGLKAFEPPAEDVKKSFFAQMKARAAAQGRGAKASGVSAPATQQRAQAPAQQSRPQQPAPRPAPVGSRGPGARPAPPVEDDVPSFDTGADDCPF